ncbi:MAG: hypothetical protein NC204_04700 [Candidatus Amulumruptor caecigallinarius]|nr:hypothetical protein [Candidatus Amulumruptor caecigallinarius]
MDVNLKNSDSFTISMEHLAIKYGNDMILLTSPGKTIEIEPYELISIKPSSNYVAPPEVEDPGTSTGMSQSYIQNYKPQITITSSEIIISNLPEKGNTASLYSSSGLLIACVQGGNTLRLPLPDAAGVMIIRINALQFKLII